jgi:hypothetical protein
MDENWHHSRPGQDVSDVSKPEIRLLSTAKPIGGATSRTSIFAARLRVELATGAAALGEYGDDGSPSANTAVVGEPTSDASHARVSYSAIG